MKTETKFTIWVIIIAGVLTWLGYLSTPSELSQRISKGFFELMENVK